MATSVLRIGRAGSLKKWLESRGTLISAPTAALCTKNADPPKPAKPTSIKKAKPAIDKSVVLQHRTRVEFPKKEVVARAEMAALPMPTSLTDAPPAAASFVDVAPPVPGPVFSTEAVPSKLSPALVPMGTVEVQGEAAPETQVAFEELTVAASVVPPGLSVKEAGPEGAVAEAGPVSAEEAASDPVSEVRSPGAVPKASAPVGTTEALPQAAPKACEKASEVFPKAKNEETLVAAEVTPAATPVPSSPELVSRAPVIPEAAEGEGKPEPKAEALKSPEAQVDPIQKLFIEKIREYSSKSKSGGGLVDAGPEYERNLAEEINRLQRLYGGGDLTKFPDFKFPEPKLEEVSTK